MPSEVRFSAITGFRVVTAALDDLADFYRAIGFAVGELTPITPVELAVLGLDGGGFRRPMRLGASRVALDTFDRPGVPYPADATACDLIFQHLALVTDDANAAWRRASDAGATPISRGGPVTLPRSAGGVTAIKFRDPEGHPLEFLQFPPGTNPRWAGTGIMGVDHTAICVAEVRVSQSFYQNQGLSDGARSLNEGPTQAQLDGLDDVEVDIVPLNPPEKPPHLELLGYRRPRGMNHGAIAANDVAATRIVWRADRDALLRDPDEHLHQLTR